MISAKILQHFLLITLSLCACACATRRAAPIGVRSGFVSVEGGKMFYESAGIGDTLVFLHGGFGDRRMWDDHFTALAADYRVVRCDLRGFGRSPRPETAYSPVDDLRRLLDELEIQRATLIGNSMGGALSIDFALLHPSV